jgi:hypothetical protein
LFRYQIRNRWHFMLKNYQTRTLVVLSPALLLHEVLQLAFVFLAGELPAWVRAVRGLRRWTSTLAGERRKIAQLRQVSDRHLLSSAPLVVRQDLATNVLARAFKHAYDGWLAIYWRLARLFLA